MNLCKIIDKPLNFEICLFDAKIASKFKNSQDIVERYRLYNQNTRLQHYVSLLKRNFGSVVKEINYILSLEGQLLCNRQRQGRELKKQKTFKEGRMTVR